MKTNEAKEITGSLSKPSKMPGFAYGLPAKECKTGKKLQNVEGSTCYDCYALKGCYVFKVVQDAQYKRLAAIRHPLWVRAMAAQISSKKSKFFRWHDSGDVQDVEHLQKIYEVCKLTPDVQHWMPTREAWVKPYLKDAPANPGDKIFNANGKPGSSGELASYIYGGDNRQDLPSPRSR
jgi:hypothetical protein